MTLNDFLEDETTIQLLGQEFGCEITIDTAEEKRIRITDKTIKEELQQSASRICLDSSPCRRLYGTCRPWQNQSDRCDPQK